MPTRLNAGHNFAWVARRVTPQVAAAVRALNMKGIYFQKEFQRFYPDNQIAAQVLGYVGVDDNGLGGLEEKFDGDLHGAPGRMYTAMDARRKVLGSTEHEPEPGRNLVLTIDENIQFMAERALDHAMEKTQALNGTVVVQDVHTGQILALAIRPTFNPNEFRHTTPALLRDHAVSDVYEPGSTFKLVTYAAALDQHVTTPDDMIDCQGGQITLSGRVIHDDKSDRGIGTVTVATALARSSDVAAIKLALKLGPDAFYKYIRAFGFGQRSGIELPGETRGLLRPVERWQPASIGYVAIGQEVAVTPLQLVTMVSTIANGGVYLPPHVLMPDPSTPTDPNQKAAPPQVAQQFAASPSRRAKICPIRCPPGAHRVISTMTAAQMRKMMEGVVLFGTGKDAQLDGYSSGGKTGTAQKIDPATHPYSKTMHIASFAGFAPVNNPVISVAVDHRLAEGRSTTAPRLRAGICRSGAAGAGISGRAARYRSAPGDLAAKKEAARHGRRCCGARAKIFRRLPCGQRSAQRRSAAHSDSKAAQPPATPHRRRPRILQRPKPARHPSPPPRRPHAPEPLRRTREHRRRGRRRKLRVPSLIGLSVREVIEQARQRRTRSRDHRQRHRARTGARRRNHGSARHQNRGPLRAVTLCPADCVKLTV